MIVDYFREKNIMWVDFNKINELFKEINVVL